MQNLYLGTLVEFIIYCSLIPTNLKLSKCLKIILDRVYYLQECLLYTPDSWAVERWLLLNTILLCGVG